MTTDEERPQLDPLAPWPTLAERDAGTLPEPDLYEGVPPHMDRHLQEWVRKVLRYQDELVRTVATRCRMSWTATAEVTTGQGSYSRQLTTLEAINRFIAGKQDGIVATRGLDRLSVVDAIINLHPDWEATQRRSSYEPSPQEVWIEQLFELNTLLRDCGSAWYVDGEFRGLYRRVDPTATEAWRQARQTAEDAGRVKASQYLADAWQAIYGQHPNPSDSYSAAVKAVESAALPVVFPDRKERGKKPTVHQVRTELSKKEQRWRFALAESDEVAPGEGSIDVVATMLDRFLRGETERHADDENRPSEQAEAEAAVHLAVLLVQWFVTGAIQSREHPA